MKKIIQNKKLHLKLQKYPPQTNIRNFTKTIKFLTITNSVQFNLYFPNENLETKTTENKNITNFFYKIVNCK